jgi:hypothetical protein
MIKKGPPNGKFSIYPAPPRFHFPEFDGGSKACSSTRHGAWALENTRRRPPFVPSPCLYDPCISKHQTAHVRAHKPPPGGVTRMGLVRVPPHGICTSSKKDPTLQRWGHQRGRPHSVFAARSGCSEVREAHGTERQAPPAAALQIAVEGSAFGAGIAAKPRFSDSPPQTTTNTPFVESINHHVRRLSGMLSSSSSQIVPDNEFQSDLEQRESSNHKSDVIAAGRLGPL